MKNIDISRDSFDSRNGFSRVVWQQGRPQLDADLNEHASIMLHTLRAMMADLVGRFGGPFGHCGFRIILSKEDIEIDIVEAEKNEVIALIEAREQGDMIVSRGRYYVDGLLCENHRFLHYSHQASAEHRAHGIEEAGCYLVYLDVWEREITALEDDAIREVALGGPDTAARMQVVWQVRTIALRERAQGFLGLRPAWEELAAGWQSRHRGALKARAREAVEPDEARPAGGSHTYRGPENQLYRVEIHQGGKVGEKHHPSFKFSRDNGVVALRVETISEDGLTVSLLERARDETMAIAAGDIVELVDESGGRHARSSVLSTVVWVDPSNREIKVDGALFTHVPHADNVLVLRRWDQREGDPRKGGLTLVDGAAVIVEEQWLKLEDGIEISFDSRHAHEYRSGDYWLIPARVATGDVIWPQDEHEPAALPPQGVEHHYAPLAIVEYEGDELKLVVPLTRQFGYRSVEGFADDMFVYSGQR